MVVATQHCAALRSIMFEEEPVCQVTSSFVDKLTIFCLGIMILDGNVQ